MPWRVMKAFAKSFELSSCAAACVGPKIGEAGRAERVDDARGQRPFGADHGERDLAFAGEGDEVGDGGRPGR